MTQKFEMIDGDRVANYETSRMTTTYTYLTLRSDVRYSQSTEAEPLASFLRTLPGLQQTGPNSFGPAEGSPWIALVLAAADASGSYHVGEEMVPLINVVELICSDDREARWYEALGTRIAEHLDWELLDDHNDRFLRPLPVKANLNNCKP